MRPLGKVPGLPVVARTARIARAAPGDRRHFQADRRQLGKLMDFVFKMMDFVLK